MSEAAPAAAGAPASRWVRLWVALGILLVLLLLALLQLAPTPALVQIEAQTEVLVLRIPAGEPLHWNVPGFEITQDCETDKNLPALRTPQATRRLMVRGPARAEFRRPGEDGVLRITVSPLGGAAAAAAPSPASDPCPDPVAYVGSDESMAQHPVRGALVLSRPVEHTRSNEPPVLAFRVRGEPTLGDDVAAGVDHMLLGGEVTLIQTTHWQSFGERLGLPASFVADQRKLGMGDRVVPRAGARCDDVAANASRGGCMEGFVRVTGGKPMAVVLQGALESVSVYRFNRSPVEVEGSLWARIKNDPLMSYLIAALGVAYGLAQFVLQTPWEQYRRPRPLPRIARALVALVVVALLLLTWSTVRAQPALPFHVRVGDDPQKELGQGLSFMRLNTCYLLTAGHVMGNERSASLIAGRTGSRVLGSGELLHRFDGDDDLAILRVSGELARQCGPELDRASAIERTVTTRAQGVVTKVLPDGGLMRLAMRVEDVGDRFLRVEPARPQDEIRQGDSGSLVTVGDAPAGLLVAVEDERGKVLRYDRVLALVERWFAAPAAAPRPRPQPAPAVAGSTTQGDAPGAVALAPVRDNLLSGRAGAQVVAWNVMPVAARFRAENLLLDDAPPWLGNLRTLEGGKWAEVDFQVSGNAAQAIGRLELVSEGVPAARRIRDFEILIRAAAESSNWTSVQGGTGFERDATTVVEFAPVRARFVRLRIHSNWGDAGAVGLRAVRAFTK